MIGDGLKLTKKEIIIKVGNWLVVTPWFWIVFCLDVMEIILFSVGSRFGWTNFFTLKFWNGYVFSFFLTHDVWITVSTVIIGIYISLYAYILTGTGSGFITRLVKKDFAKFKTSVSIINSGLVWATVFLFFSGAVQIKEITNLLAINNFVGSIFNLAYLSSFVLMMIMLIQIVLFYSLAFEEDLNGLKEQIKEEEDFIERFRRMLDRKNNH